MWSLYGKINDYALKHVFENNNSLGYYGIQILYAWKHKHYLTEQMVIVYRINVVYIHLVTLWLPIFNMNKFFSLKLNLCAVFSCCFDDIMFLCSRRHVKSVCHINTQTENDKSFYI